MITFPIWYLIALVIALIAGGFGMAMVFMQKSPTGQREVVRLDQREVVRLEIANRAMAQALRDACWSLGELKDEIARGEIIRASATANGMAASCNEALARAAGVLGGDPLRRLDMEPVAAEGERRVPRE